MNDLIRRQDAIEYFMTNTNWHDEEGYPIEDAEDKRALLTDYFNGIPSAQQEQRWIPCSERLPEKEGWYITTVESEKTRKRRIENDLFAIDIAISHGNTPYKFCKDGYRQKTIAWMPLPEPYKQEEGES